MFGKKQLEEEKLTISKNLRVKKAELDDANKLNRELSEELNEVTKRRDEIYEINRRIVAERDSYREKFQKLTDEHKEICAKAAAQEAELANFRENLQKLTHQLTSKDAQIQRIKVLKLDEVIAALKSGKELETV